MDKLIDDVTSLINKGIGDLSRLEHIKQTIENNKQLYNSDRTYVNDLVKKYLSPNPQTNKENKSSLKTEESLEKSESNLESTTSFVSTYCWNCGAKNPNTSKFCTKCGSSIIKPSDKHIESEPPSKTVKQKGMGIGKKY